MTWYLPLIFGILCWTLLQNVMMGLGTPPFFLAQLVLGSVFIEYLSHFSLIPSRLTNAISSAYERHLRKPQNNRLALISNLNG
jgi:hypothetical protein